MATKRTYQPSKRRRVRKFGYRRRNKTASGRKIIKLRRLKGRKRITV